MEKVIVRSWDDLLNNENLYSFQSRSTPIMFSCGLERNNCIKLEKNKENLNKMVEILNILGGNFEYKPVEVIDTYEKFFNFLDEIGRGDTFYIYSSEFEEFIKFEDGSFKKFTRCYKLNYIEEKYNVDLKILKESE